MRIRFATMAAALALSSPALAQDMNDDPYIWLEDVSGPRSMEWVESHNATTVKRLEADPRYATLYNEALEIAGAKDRIPSPSFVHGEVFNFWQDADHLRGIWRKTSLADYRTANPTWTTVLDIDAINAAEGKSFVFKGASCLPPDEKRCLVQLSVGGNDAVEVREFDLDTNQFVADGFNLPKGKQDVAWEDRDHILVAAEWQPGDLTESGYPYIVKRLTRGQPVSAAQEIFRGEKSDVSASGYKLHDSDGNSLTLVSRGVDFFHSETSVVTDK